MALYWRLRRVTETSQAECYRLSHDEDLRRGAKEFRLV